MIETVELVAVIRCRVRWVVDFHHLIPIFQCGLIADLAAISFLFEIAIRESLQMAVLGAVPGCFAAACVEITGNYGGEEALAGKLANGREPVDREGILRRFAVWRS